MLKIHYTVLQKNAPHYSIFNNSAKNELILIIFGVQNPEESSHQKIIKYNSPTSPKQRCRTTLLAR